MNTTEEIKEIIVQQKPAIGNSGPVLCFSFSVLCYLCWLNMMGWVGEGAGLAIGLVQMGVFVPYMVGSTLLFKNGASFEGNIFMIFAGFFACVGGLTNIVGDIAAFVGIPFSAIPGGFCWLICGLLLLCLSPAVRFAEPYTWLFYLFGGIALISAGLLVLGLTASPIITRIGAWANFGAATCGMILVVSYMIHFKGLKNLPGMETQWFKQNNTR